MAAAAEMLWVWQDQAVAPREGGHLCSPRGLFAGSGGVGGNVEFRMSGTCWHD